jgi:hypothetical protein
MKSLLIFVTVMGLTGCATPPQFLADMYDRNDPCQTGQFNETERQRLGRPVGYQMPDWCGASKGSVRVQSYVKSNGTFVRSHVRSAPDGNPYNNRSR